MTDLNRAAFAATRAKHAAKRAVDRATHPMSVRLHLSLALAACDAQYDALMACRDFVNAKDAK